MELFEEILQKYKLYNIENQVPEEINFIEDVPIMYIDKMMHEVTYSEINMAIKYFQLQYFDENEKIQNKIINFIKKYKLDINGIYSSYIKTVIYLIEKYPIETVIDILRLNSKNIEQAIFTELQKFCIEPYVLGLIATLVYYKGNIPDNNILISIGIYIFDINKNFINYIHAIGIDIYVIFLNEFYLYILNKSCNPFFWGNFIEQCYYSKLMKKRKIEKAMKFFVNNKYYSMEGLKLLESINSSYTEKYKSYLLMEELI